MNEEALAHWGLSCQQKISVVQVLIFSYVGIRYALKIKGQKAIKYVRFLTIFMA